MKKIFYVFVLVVICINQTKAQTEVVDGNLQLKGYSASNNGNLSNLSFFNKHASSNTVLAQILAKRGYSSHHKGDLAFYVKNGTSLIEGFRLNADGFIGIGTNLPQEKLHVNGGNVLVKDPYNKNIQGIYFVPSDNSKRNYIQAYQTASPTNDYLRIGSHFGSIRFATENAGAPSEKMRIIRNGNVGIGTSTPSAKLDVAGNIKAKEIEVALASMQDLNLNGTLAANNITYTANGQTADHVFEENYNLRSLEEIEAFILENKHLPDVPSAAAMEEEGVNLAEMNKLLLQKVEELTLYAIELKAESEKQTKALKERIEKLETYLIK